MIYLAVFGTLLIVISLIHRVRDQGWTRSIADVIATPSQEIKCVIL